MSHMSLASRLNEKRQIRLVASLFSTSVKLLITSIVDLLNILIILRQVACIATSMYTISLLLSLSIYDAR